MLAKKPIYLGKEKADASLSFQSSSLLKEDMPLECREKILASARELPQEGILKVATQGFVYVDLSDGYITELYPLLEKKEARPPPHFLEEGAHITALLAEENQTGLPLEALHQPIAFTIAGCYCVEPANWEEMKKVWCLTVESPQLENLRTKLALPPYIWTQMFHITFAVEKRFLSLSDILKQRDEEIVIVKNHSL